MDDSLLDLSEMSRTGSLICLSKQTIATLLECLISCLIFVSIVYIALLVFDLTSISEISSLYHPIGYISLVVLLSAPLAIYGSSSGSYPALLGYFLLASYHLYAVCIYVWLKIRSSEFKLNKASDPLHQVVVASYTTVLILSLILVICKIISNVNLLEPARVIVVDNNPSD